MSKTVEMPVLEGAAHCYVQIGENKIHYVEMGAGEPLLLLHGWPQHWYCWRFVIPKLAENYRVIVPDMRGFGWSDAPLDDAYYKEDLAEDVIALIEQLGLSNVKLVGHDWGGYVGFIVATRRPDLIERYLALNICHLWGKADLSALKNAWRFWYMGLVASPVGTKIFERRPDFVERMLKGASEHHRWTKQELKSFSDVLAQPARARASTMLYRTFLMHELHPLASGRYKSERLKVPTLILHGTHDPAIRPEMLEGYEEYADDMSVQLTDTASHFIAEDNPDLVVETARKFFSSDKT